MASCAEGGLVGVLPEARINTTADLLLPAQLGAGLACRPGGRAHRAVLHSSRAPDDGTTLGCLLKPAVVTLRIGQPIDVTPYLDRRADRKVLEELTRRLLRAIAELAGRPDYRPQISG